jgi:hypothetical protein
MESSLMAVDCPGRDAGNWSYIHGSTRNHEREGKTHNDGWMLQLVYAVLDVCCTRCIQYSVYAVLGVCCTRCILYCVNAVLRVCCTRYMLYSGYDVLGVCCTRWMPYLVYAAIGVCVCWGYAVLCVNSWSWHGEIKRNDLTLCYAMMVELCMRMREMGDKDKNNRVDTRGYEKLGVWVAWSGLEDLVLV